MLDPDPLLAGFKLKFVRGSYLRQVIHVELYIHREGYCGLAGTAGIVRDYRGIYPRLLDLGTSDREDTTEALQTVC